jgi:hypothetical protein
MGQTHIVADNGMDGWMVWFSCGDSTTFSRVYLVFVRHGAAYRMTQDHGDSTAHVSLWERPEKGSKLGG